MKMSNKITIIGGGFAGYTAALRLSRGNDVTLIEKENLGGTCLNKGCIPTKLFLHYSLKEKILGRIQEKSEKTISGLASGIKLLLDNKKITYINDEAKIAAKNRLLLKKAGKTLSFDTLILSIGSEPIIPEKFRGSRGALTSDNIIKLEETPKRLVIIGGGYIGVEFAHIFSNLGTKVTIIEKEKAILPTIDTDASSLLTKAMTENGIRIITGKTVEKIQGSKAFISNGEEIPYDNVLLCIGRKAKPVESDIPIESENGRIRTDDFFQTSQQGIMAIGDCTSGPLLAHKAAYDAEILSANLLNGKKQKKDYSKIPFCIFSEPNISGVGEMKDLETIKARFSAIGKAHCDESTEGFLKLAIDKDKRIRGGIVVNKNALEVLSALTVIVEKGMTCDEVSRIVFAHPTSAEIIKEAAKKALG